jgi:hypothetical protein
MTCNIKYSNLRFGYLIFLMLCGAGAQAQFPIRVQVNIIQPVPPYLPQIKADIAGNRSGLLNQDISSHLSIILTHTGQAQNHIKLSGSIQRVSPSPIGVSLRPDFQPAQPIIMGPQQQLISLNQQMLQSAFGNFNENSLIYTNTDLNTLRQNGVDYKLPEGTYRVCVTAYDYDRPGFSAPLSAPGTGCAFFTICYTASAPQLILPVSTMMQSNSAFQDFTPHSQQIQFVWTPPVTTCGTPLGALTYGLEIRRVFEGQTVTDAQSNPYVFHQQNIPSTTFFLDTMKYPHVLVPGQKYTIRIKANFTPLPGSPLDIANQGYSQIGAFAYLGPIGAPGNAVALMPVTPPGLPIPPGNILPGGYVVQSYTPGGTCPAAMPITNTTAFGSGLTGQDLTMDGFKMHIDQATPNSDGTFKGNGYIVWHPFASDIKLAVNFDTLKVNTDKVVFGGTALTSTVSGNSQWSPFGATDPVTRLTGMDQNSCQALAARFNSGANMINQGLGGGEMAFPLGVNTTLGGAPFTLAIMGISFRPACTNMNVLLDMNLPDMGGWLALAGTGFQVDPNKLLLQDKGGVLYLPQNQNLSTGGMHFNLDGCPGAGGGAVDTSRGTYVAWDDINGLRAIVVNADMQFADNNSIVAVDKNDKRLSDPAGVHLKFSFTNWNDWVAAATLPNDFELAGLPGFPIHSDALFYDHSGKQNPVGIVFPAKYIGAQDAGFQGLYIPSLTMGLPNNFLNFNGSKPSGFGFHNFILDNSGVTTTISADNILDISTGSLGGWAFSIDHIQIGMVQNNFQDGMQMLGQVKLPISTTSLAYSCDLNSSDGQVNYQFVAKPSGQLDVPLWIAKISLDPNSSLVINNDHIGMAVKSQLNGSISVAVSVKGFPKVTLPGLDFQGMAMANRHDMTAGAAAGFYFDPGKWSFGGMDLSGVAGGRWKSDPEGGLLAGGPSMASGPMAQEIGGGGGIGGYQDGLDAWIDGKGNAAPDDAGSSGQGTVAGFGISLSDFAPSFAINSMQQFEAGVYFNLNVNIGFGDASVISGTTRLGLLGQINVPGNAAPSVAFDKVDVKQIILHGGIGPVTVDGQLDFLNDDPVYGDGIKGSLSAKFPFAELTAAAQFGTTLGSGGFHYWAVGGSIFLEAGILIGPGLTCNGFGGGIYHNMSLTTPADADIRSHNTSTNPGTIPMVPQVNTTGIQAQLIVAVIQPTIVNASLLLSVEVHNGGLSLMQLNGNGFVITDPPDNSDALAKATMVMKYDFANQLFDTYIEVDFQFLISSARAPIWMHGGPDGDYIYVGRPDQGDQGRVSLQLIDIGNPGDVLYVNLGATAYFDAGTELPPFPPLPPDISSNLSGKSDADNAVTSMLQLLASHKDAGFMFGAEVHGHVRLELLFLYAQVDAELGFDVALRRITTPPASCVQGDGTFGLNNWYGMGQFYAYFNMDIGIHVDAWFYTGDVALVSEKAWAVMQAGIPNPSWVDGEVHVEGSALGGLVSVSGDFPFSFGSECTVPFNPLDDIQMITGIGPADSATVFDMPYDVFSVPMNGSDYPITVPPDKDHSTSYVRTFRFTQELFNLSKVTPGGDSLAVSIGSGGDLSMSPDGLGSSLYHNSIMQPHSQYKIYIKCDIMEVINGQQQPPVGNRGYQDTVFTFTTGAAPDNITADDLDYSYPITGQRCLLQNEFGRRGVIRLGQWLPNLVPPVANAAASLTGYTYEVYFIPASGGDTIKAPFTGDPASKTLNFQLPAGLQNNMIYDLQAWVKPKGNAAIMAMLAVGKKLQVQTNQAQRNVQEVNNQGQTIQRQIISNSQVTISKNVVSTKPQSHVLGSIPIFTLRFQTSGYNAFSDKMGAYGQWTSQQEDNFRDISLYAGNATAEQFDEFDMKGYTSTCKYCDPNSFPGAYPPLFSAVIPWDNNIQNDKYASDNLYANAFLLAVNGILVDLGAANVRDAMHPVYTLFTDGIPYQPKLPLFSIQQQNFSAATVGKNMMAGNTPTTSKGGGSSQVSMQRAGGGGSVFYSQGAQINLPASYKSGGSANSVGAGASTSGGGTGGSMELSATVLGGSVANAVAVVGPRLLWKHDNYIYADYQLFQQFGSNFLADQHNTVWMGGASFPQSLLEALAYGNDVSLAVGEYGSITANPGSYSNKWNDPTLTGMATAFQSLAFQPFPATAASPLQFKYQFPFCSGCAGSTVPEQFRYGNAFSVLPSASMKTSIQSGLTPQSSVKPKAPAGTPAPAKALPMKLSTSPISKPKTN